MQNAAAISTVSWISISVAPSARARSTSSGRTARPLSATLRRDSQERAELLAHRRGREVGADLVDELCAGLELCARERAMGGVAELAAVEVRDVRRDQLTLATAQRVLVAEQRLGQLEKRPRGLGAELHGAANARDAGLEIDVGHGLNATAVAIASAA